jgi:beta-N-acetylhexosaminidase
VRYAVLQGEIPMSRLDDSVYRILRLKKKRGLFENAFVDVDAAEAIVGAPAHLADARAITDRTTTLVKNHAGLLPLGKDLRKVLVTGFSPKTGPVRILEAIGAAIGPHGPAVTIVDTGTEPTQALIDRAAAEAEQNDLVVVATGSANSVTAATGELTPPAKAQVNLVNALLAKKKPVVAVAVRNPYDIARFPGVDAYLAIYGSTPHSIESLVRVLFGDVRPTGKLPVRILTADGTCTLYSLGHGLSYHG